MAFFAKDSLSLSSSSTEEFVSLDEYIYSQDSIEEKIPQSPLHVVYEQLSQRMEYELVLYKANASIPYKSGVCIQSTPRFIDGTIADQFFCAFDLSQVLFV